MRFPYEITIRDPELLGAKPGNHEVVFTRGNMSTVIELDDDELKALAGVAIGRMIKTMPPTILSDSEDYPQEYSVADPEGA